MSDEVAFRFTSLGSVFLSFSLSFSPATRLFSHRVVFTLNEIYKLSFHFRKSKKNLSPPEDETASSPNHLPPNSLLSSCSPPTTTHLLPPLPFFFVSPHEPK